MAIRRVLVIWINPLFHESVRLLLQQPEIEWVGATSDHAAIPVLVASLHPDTVLIEVDEQHNDAAQVQAILGAGAADLRVFLLSLNANELLIYHREQKTVGQPQDLLRLIQAQPSNQA